jgi:hypothetical protein
MGVLPTGASDTGGAGGTIVPISCRGVEPPSVGFPDSMSIRIAVVANANHRQRQPRMNRVNFCSGSQKNGLRSRGHDLALPPGATLPPHDFIVTQNDFVEIKGPRDLL